MRVPLRYPWALGTKQTKETKVFGCRKMALFKNRTGKINAVDEVCPHRGAKLSRGKNINGCIQCPYHGWEFDENGTLVKVPTTNHIPNVSINSYETEDIYDIVWMVPPDSIVSPPIYTQITSKGWHRVSGSREVKGNWIDWIANSTDISHINYVHEFADEQNGTIDNMEIEEYKNRTLCTASVRPKASHLFTKYFQVKNSDIKCEFVYPNTTIIHIKLKEPYEFITYTTVTPIDENNTRISWCFAHNISSVFNEYFEKRTLKTILEDEAIISEIPLDFVFDTNVPCDKFQMAVLKRIEEMIVDNEENLFYKLDDRNCRF